jgi:isobutyryl-CoA mutase
MSEPPVTVLKNPVRFVTAASLFDGHDAAINIIRRLLQSHGAEVVHLGHNRSVEEVVAAALEEDAHGVAVSSYQGGHVEYFSHLVDRLRASGLEHVKVFGGGGGVIVPSEIEFLHAQGVTRIFSPHDGQRMGLEGMTASMIDACDVSLVDEQLCTSLTDLFTSSPRTLARVITSLEAGVLAEPLVGELRDVARRKQVPVVGITGTGGSGKSSLTDELIRRFRLDQSDKLRIAVLAVDPTRRRGGGALLGDRIRMNAINSERVFFRSLATRGSAIQVPESLDDVIAACKAWGADLVIVETPGIGQGDSGIVQFVDLALYVMTPDYGAATQLEKIDMLDFADFVVINKFERRGAEDALRDVRRQLARSRGASPESLDELPVFGTISSRFNDDGVTALYHALCSALKERGLPAVDGWLPECESKVSTRNADLVPSSRIRYLADVADAVRSYHQITERQAAIARRRQQLTAVRDELSARAAGTTEVEHLRGAAEEDQLPECRELIAAWPSTVDEIANDESLVRRSLSGLPVPRIALPRLTDHGDLLRWLRNENLPGRFPYTAGVFALRRDDEEAARMFAGEGGPARTNRRFHFLAEGQPATRLSTAFDSVTLYGSDPNRRPDVYGKIGTSGVSIATLDDMKDLYAGFDLCDPSTSVSMTINGPAPIILAMFFNAAIDQRVERFQIEQGRPPDEAERADLSVQVLDRVRGTVQADILKEDQGQNTCIFSTEFSLRTMADIQEWFIQNHVSRFYSVSISGYHIAEAGANPITQLAFTLANGFTYVEAFLARGMQIDEFASSLSFFFSNGMDPEYTVLGRVARRIWAIAMRDRYRADERSQKLKYHIQTSGRSLHAQEMAFNDIRTTLQALCAIYDSANSLHTNAYDEAVTTPTEDSVRRALAIQLIINREWGLAMNENPLQGSFIVEDLTDLVEEAVLSELERLSDRGGVLGAMETGYQRGRIQDESMLYEHRKHDGSLPIVGVNTFVKPGAEEIPRDLELARSDDDEKEDQLARVEGFKCRHASESPRALEELRKSVIDGHNTFDALMSATRTCTLGEISGVLFEVGGQYRRNV